MIGTIIVQHSLSDLCTRISLAVGVRSIYHGLSLLEPLPDGDITARATRGGLVITVGNTPVNNTSMTNFKAHTEVR